MFNIYLRALKYIKNMETEAEDTKLHTCAMAMHRKMYSGKKRHTVELCRENENYVWNAHVFSSFRWTTNHFCVSFDKKLAMKTTKLKCLRLHANATHTQTHKHTWLNVLRRVFWENRKKDSRQQTSLSLYPSLWLFTHVPTTRYTNADTTHDTLCTR